MKITVIMLTYNRQDFVSRMIESVLQQSYGDYEFIIVDNGSTDKSGEIADRYAHSDHRIRVIHKGKGNIGSGRNAGLDVARGDFIAFIDDDDYLERDYLKYLYELTQEYHADIAICGSWREICAVKTPKYIFDGIEELSGQEAVYEMLRREKFNSSTPTKLISRRIFEGLRFSTSGKYDDVECTYRILAKARKVVLSGKPFYTFVRHSANNSKGTTQGEQMEAAEVSDYLKAFRDRSVWLGERFPDMTDYWIYTELSYALSMYEKIPDDQLREHLARIIRENLRIWNDTVQYHSARDQKLWEEYGGTICES